MNSTAALRQPGTTVSVQVVLEPGVDDLLWRLGEDSLTVELTLDFEGPVQKQAVAFPGAAEPSLGFQRVRVGHIDVWWRQRVVLASIEPRVTSVPRPRRLVIGRVGRALSAYATYAEHPAN
jgi:hypothetical protein